MSKLYEVEISESQMTLRLLVGNKASFTEKREDGQDAASWSLVCKGGKAMLAAAGSVPKDWTPPENGSFKGMSRTRAQTYKLERLMERLTKREAGEVASERSGKRAEAKRAVGLLTALREATEKHGGTIPPEEFKRIYAEHS